MGACSSSEPTQQELLQSFEGTKPTQDMFECLATLGIGSFGTVMCCRRKGTSQFVAIKTIQKARLFRRTDHSALVWNERDAMIKCSSPFLVGLLCSFHSHHELYLVLPFHIGGDLSHLVRLYGPMQEAEVRFFLAEMVLGLEAMHDMHICHRDIKPDNVLIDVAGHAVITDMGLALEYRPKELRHSSRFWGQCGSYGYRAPEVVCDGVCGPYSDMYSLGVAVYFLLYSRVPWTQTQLALDGMPLLFPPELKISDAMRDLVTRTLDLNARTRITGAEIKEHEVFKGVKWDLVYSKNKKSGLGRPRVTPDPENFSFPNVNHDSGGSPTQQFKSLTPEQETRFNGFQWVPGDPVTVFGNVFHWSPSTNLMRMSGKGTPERQDRIASRSGVSAKDVRINTPGSKRQQSSTPRRFERSPAPKASAISDGFVDASISQKPPQSHSQSAALERLLTTGERAMIKAKQPETLQDSAVVKRVTDERIKEKAERARAEKEIIEKKNKERAERVKKASGFAHSPQNTVHRMKLKHVSDTAPKTGSDGQTPAEPPVVAHPSTKLVNKLVKKLGSGGPK